MDVLISLIPFLVILSIAALGIALVSKSPLRRLVHRYMERSAYVSTTSIPAPQTHSPRLLLPWLWLFGACSFVSGGLLHYLFGFEFFEGLMPSDLN
jgi:hypothetical protein